MLRGCTSPAHNIYKRFGDLYQQRMWLRNSFAFEGITQKTPLCKTHSSPTKNCCSCSYPMQVQESKEQIWPIFPQMRNRICGRFIFLFCQCCQSSLTFPYVRRFQSQLCSIYTTDITLQCMQTAQQPETALPKAALQCSFSTPRLPGAVLGV